MKLYEGDDRSIEMTSITQDLIPHHHQDNKVSEEVHVHKHSKKDGGIGYTGSMAIAVNILVGPAILNLPATFQKSGFIPTILVITAVCILSILCSLNLANVVSKIPKNANFEREVEYSELFRIFWGDKWYMFTHINFYACILCQTIASIVDTSQVVDEFLVNMNHETYALKVYPFPAEIVSWDKSGCPPADEGGCNPFNLKEDGKLVLSLGYAICAVVFLPMGLMDLKENTAFQIFGYVLLLAISAQFIWVFIMRGLSVANLSLWGESWSELFGIILFNYTFTTAVPAWISEKSHHVHVPEVLNKSNIMASALYIAVGALGALSIPNVSDNMLSSMIIGDFGKTTQISASLFAFFIIGLGIPLFCVLMKMNLVGSGLCTSTQGNMVAVFLPWLIGWLFYKGSAAAKLLSWGGVIFTSIIAFIAPLLLSIYSVTKNMVGSINVYGNWNLSKRQEITALSFLLMMSVVCVTFPITEIIIEHFL